MLTAISSDNHDTQEAEAKPQATLFHQLNLQANAVRRSVGRSTAGRPEPMRLVKVMVDQD